MSVHTYRPDLDPYLREYREEMTLKKLIKAVQECLKDPANRAEFEQWYLEKYGKPYVWKKEKKE